MTHQVNLLTIVIVFKTLWAVFVFIEVIKSCIKVNLRKTAQLWLISINKIH